MLNDAPMMSVYAADAEARPADAAGALG